MDLEAVYRDERPRALATLIRLLRDFDLAEEMLQEAFASISSQAQGLQGRYLPQMQEQARTMDVGKVLSMVRGRA